ncbi:hypothetical protein AK812_SmicGene33287 [Symbiodinium microadriaticum]|uniref:Endonuclease/exonuclease/phosphatase domain-containing protein n=1 Tax=Symbiodinium microadriaticum TaxID=2951 RepID=A0A1Q9CRZ2_SYMMI|nr:hypothetical protein AK812_SmicGene33287 [Symbiodinium microadriaticum]
MAEVRPEDVSIPHSPTSVVQDMDEDGEGFVEDAEEAVGAAVGNHPGDGHGKRRRPDRSREGGLGEDFDDESPSKRGQRAEGEESGVVTSRELRLLLGQHMRDMKAAWGVVEQRVAAVEKTTKGHDKELKAVHIKHKALDNKVLGIQAKGDATARKTDDIHNELQKLQTRVDDIEKKQSTTTDDPWADYLNNKKGAPHDIPHKSAGKDETKGLSEEDQRTLIVGGWLPDTRRAKIEEEVKIILEEPDIKPSLDSDRLVVFGPRRSFGMLRFQVRDGESPTDVKKRMWEVIAKIRGGKYILPSTQGEHGHGGKMIWASFLKTPEARRRSALCSLVRRITIQLAGVGNHAKNEAAMVNESYDVDWGTGTIWNGELKLASATHRKDAARDEDFFQLNQGWVDLRNLKEDKSSVQLATWNLGGQPVGKVTTGAPGADIFLVQEIARGDSGWQEHETDTHFWLTHRREEQWRGTGVGISNEIFDSVISRKQTARGMLALVKLRDRGKIILGSLHAYTGVTNRVYQQEIHAFLRELGGKWRKYPCVIGVDANEAVTWDSGGLISLLMRDL